MFSLARVVLLLLAASLLVPFDSIRGALGHLSPHLRSTAGGAAAGGGGGGGGGGATPAAATSAAASQPLLPAGGGGDGPDVEWFEECQAALSCAECGVARDPSRPPFKLPHAYDELRAVVDRADFTRAAVMSAWSEILGEVPELKSLRPHFTALETSFDVEHQGWADYVGPRARERVPYKDECVYDGTGACDVHKFRVERPLTEAQRGDPAAATGDAFLKRAPYDFQMYSQTFEHLYDPPLALARMFDLAAPGGLVWASVPAWNIIHMNPSHQQGVTPCGLFSLFRGAGFEVLKLGWYGNEAYSDVLARAGSNWPSWPQLPFGDPFKGMPPTAPGGRVNTVWGLARRPAAGKPPLPLPAPRPTAQQLAARPNLDTDDMIDAAEIKSTHAKGPSAAALRALLRRFPTWANGDVAALALAGTVQEAFLPKVAAAGANDGGGGGGGGGGVLLFGRTANALAAALLPAAALRPWVPPGLQIRGSAPLPAAAAAGAGPPPPPPRRARAAFLSDLFESVRDPLDVLTRALAEVAPGSPLLITCRPADVVAAGRPSLGVCTELGFTQLLFRAGLLAGGHARGGGFSSFAAEYGAWGRVDYTNRALAKGQHTSLTDFAATAASVKGKPGAEALLKALAAGAPAAAGGEEALLDELLAELAEDAGQQGKWGWAAVAWVLLVAP
jgi:hypothetical protein